MSTTVEELERVTAELVTPRQASAVTEQHAARTTRDELHPGPREIRRQNRRTAFQIIARVVIIFAAWLVVVFLFAVLVGAV